VLGAGACSPSSPYRQAAAAGMGIRDLRAGGAERAGPGEEFEGAWTRFSNLHGPWGLEFKRRDKDAAAARRPTYEFGGRPTFLH